MGALFWGENSQIGRLAEFEEIGGRKILFLPLTDIIFSNPSL
jgi:hypothetical protein